MGESACLVRSFSQPAEFSSRETNEAGPRRFLTESVSFGRFASESLAWEKWSAFTQNRYLEEVERFTKPGSVAQKKAFFEAHFKNRAAGRATQTKIGKLNDKTSDEIVCDIRKDNLVDSQVPLVVNIGTDMDELRHAEVDSVVQSVSVMDETTDVQTGEDEALDVENLNLNSMAVPQDEALDEENPTSMSKEKRSSSSRSKACSISSKLEPSFVIGLDLPLKKIRKELPSSSVSKKQNISPPESFHMPINCAPSGNTNKKISGMPQNGSRSSTNAKGAGKADKKKRSGPSPVHMSLNFASSARETTITAPKNLARNSTIQKTTSSSARNSVFQNGKEPTGALKSRKRPLPTTAKEGSNAAKCSTRASAFRLPELPPPDSRPLEDKRKNITIGSSGKHNNVQRKPYTGCKILSTQSRTREKSFTVSSPFNFRSNERAERRKEFFKKLEEKNKKGDAVKEQSSCGLKTNQITHLSSEEHKNSQVPLRSLTSPRSCRNHQTLGKENIKKSHKPSDKVSSINASMEKHKRCKIHPSSRSQTKKKTQENLSPNIMQNYGNIRQ